MKITSQFPLLLVGAGKMGGALLAGWLERGLDPESIVICDPNLNLELKNDLAGKGVRFQEGVNRDLKPLVVFFAVKPQIMHEVLKQNAETVGEGTLVVSIAAGTPISMFESVFGSVSVVRAMPNTPAQVMRGITAVVGNKLVSSEQRDLVVNLLSAVGNLVWLENEEQIDLATAVSGSGPAYVFLLAECLAEAGRQAGLPADTANQLAVQTVSGAGELMHQSNSSPSELRNNVTSPGGTTEAALRVLMDSNGLQPLITEAVKAAADRASELVEN